MPLNIIDHQK